jgi:Tol biopolymer transport system component
MPLQVGESIGGYQVVAQLGAGGMGEVYRARDHRLQRDVAIKILAPRIAGDADGVRRFEREARMLAALNHPHIAAIYGVEESSSGQPALVLELVDGETLGDRLARGKLPIAEAIGYVKQVADALDTAHEAGIVHRDLKPGNIKINAAGTVKVLDFGLAKAIAAVHEPPPDQDLAHSPTVTAQGTAHGLILGTAAYMSPEQARGKRIDKRTDIWAFGCVLFEMLSGHRAFDGETPSDVIAAIIEGAPDWSQLPASTPAHLRRIVERCLEKDPRRRLRDIADARGELDALPNTEPANSARRPGWQGLKLIATCAAGIAIGVLAALATRAAPPADGRVLRSSLLLPEGVRVSRASILPIAIADDGSAVAFIGERDGQNQLYLQRLDQAEAVALPGTEGATQPFFSPDALWVGYIAEGALQKVAVDGHSVPIRITAVGPTTGASWGPGDTIVWAMRGGGLQHVNAVGGAPTAIAGVTFAQFPQWLPDGKNLLFTTGRDANDSGAFAVIGIEGGQPRVVARLNDSSLDGAAVLGAGGNLMQAQFVDRGFIVFGQSPGSVRSLPMNADSLAPAGAPVPFADSVERGAGNGGMYFAASRSGVVVFAQTGERHQLVWVDRRGRETPLSDDRRAFRAPRISPDGSTVVVAANDDRRLSDLWLYDAARGTQTRRLTTASHNLSPVWTRDGTAVIFFTIFTTGEGGLLRLPVGGEPSTLLSAEERRGRLPLGTEPYPRTVLPDGGVLVQANQDDIWRVTMDGKVEPVLTRPANDSAPALSLDGRWLAHASTESGRSEVYLRRYPSLDQSTIVSTNGGTSPVWSRDGRELFYRQGDAMMAVRVELGESARVSAPTALFSGRYVGTAGDVTFDVAPDGRFLMVKSDPASELRHLSIVHNWFASSR